MSLKIGPAGESQPGSTHVSQLCLLGLARKSVGPKLHPDMMGKDDRKSACQSDLFVGAILESPSQLAPVCSNC